MGKTATRPSTPGLVLFKNWGRREAVPARRQVAALSLGWDEQENKLFTQSGGNTVGVKLQPSIAKNVNVSFLNLDSGDQGRFLYETIDWSVSRPVTRSNGSDPLLGTTSLGELNVTFPNSGQVVTPLLLNKLITGAVFTKVEHKEANLIEPFSPLNDWSVSHHRRLHLVEFSYRNLQSAAKV